MARPHDIEPESDRVLVLTRIIPAARVRHWSVADRKTHEEMGFHRGWGQCADQLAALVAKL